MSVVSWIFVLPLGLMANLGGQAWAGVVAGILAMYYAFSFSFSLFWERPVSGMVLAYIGLLWVPTIGAELWAR